ncbi:hypothetical protein ICM_05513 [Bacillus cereus BAG1X2-3]|nr:N-acetylmuramoyl-L-alanine amidase BlyA [Bacillus cereus BAG1X1-1]EOO42999.1 N-acetylmuramoyl-L-alanine amidase BlyA [Bacillus cereus BAG1X2-1]EOO56489.1 hypothetical protein ICM_05513 [Bacillus cereus BAG1X2-3]EOP00020.1 N-acetylmuramoyl-L-alanine amidase BlyA [Bacillus cereus BAG2O-1]
MEIHLYIYTPNGEKKIYYKGAGKANSVGAITGMSLGSVTFLEINLLNMQFIQEAFRRTLAAKKWIIFDSILNRPGRIQMWLVL